MNFVLYKVVVSDALTVSLTHTSCTTNRSLAGKVFTNES